MTSRTIGSNAQLGDLIELFFQDLRAFGVFACHGRTPKKDLVDGYIKNRLGILDFILQAAEPSLGTTLENTSLPILANTVRWPEHTPIAGYNTPGSGINYSHLLPTYFGNWVYEYSHGPFYIRLIRAGLWMWYKNGLESAIRYLFDLQKYGYFTVEKGVEDTIAILIASQTLGKDTHEIVAIYFNGKVPQSEVEWMNWDFEIPQSVYATFDLSVIQPILEFIILDTFRTWAKFAPLKSPLSLQASYLPLMFRANFGEEGMERLYNDRLIYPAVLQESIAQYGVKVLKENKDLFQWSIIPPRIFHPYAALFSAGFPDATLRAEFFPIEQIVEMPIVRQFFGFTKSGGEPILPDGIRTNASLHSNIFLLVRAVHLRYTIAT